MNELITIRAARITGGDPQQAVDARELHEFLEVRRDFSSWMKDRIAMYGFGEGEDYCRISRSPDLGSGNRGAAVDYHLSLEMAKELAMVERTEKGKQARQYFIECERQVRAQALAGVPRTFAEALRLAADLTEAKDRLQATVEAQAPKVAALAQLAEAEGLLNLNVAAKHFDMQPSHFNAWLMGMKWIYKRTPTARWTAREYRMLSGDLTHKVVELKRETAHDPGLMVTQVMVTAKGMTHLAQIQARERKRTAEAAAAAAQQVGLL